MSAAWLVGPFIVALYVAWRMQLHTLELRRQREYVAALEQRIVDMLQSSSGESSEPIVISAGTRLPPPDPPRELIDVVAAGECVLSVGDGILARAGYPTYAQLVASTLDQLAHWMPDPRWEDLREQAELEVQTNTRR